MINQILIMLTHIRRSIKILMKASNIKWDTDGYSPKELGLPKAVDIPKGMYDLDDVSDYLSDAYEFCHKGFKVIYTEEDVRDCLLQEFNENEYDLDNLKKIPQAVIDTILQEANTSQQDLLSVVDPYIYYWGSMDMDNAEIDTISSDQSLSEFDER